MFALSLYTISHRFTLAPTPYSSLDIGQLRHLNKAVACHKSSPFCVVKVRSYFATDLSVAAVSAASADGTANENCGSNFHCIIAAVVTGKL